MTPFPIDRHLTVLLCLLSNEVERACGVKDLSLSLSPSLAGYDSVIEGSDLRKRYLKLLGKSAIRK